MHSSDTTPADLDRTGGVATDFLVLGGASGRPFGELIPVKAPTQPPTIADTTPAEVFVMPPNPYCAVMIGADGRRQLVRREHLKKYFNRAIRGEDLPDSAFGEADGGEVDDATGHPHEEVSGDESPYAVVEELFGDVAGEVGCACLIEPLWSDFFRGRWSGNSAELPMTRAAMQEANVLEYSPLFYGLASCRCIGDDKVAAAIRKCRGLPVKGFEVEE
jgi:hypothetical protein